MRQRAAQCAEEAEHLDMLLMHTAKRFPFGQEKSGRSGSGE
jgi:hypothetical protein